MAVVFWGGGRGWEMRRGHNCPTVREQEKTLMMMMTTSSMELLQHEPRV